MLGRSNTDLRVSASPADGLLLIEGDAAAGRRCRRNGAEAEGRTAARGASSAQLRLGGFLSWAGVVGLASPSGSGHAHASQSTLWTTCGVDWSPMMVDTQRRLSLKPRWVTRSAWPCCAARRYRRGARRGASGSLCPPISWRASRAERRGLSLSPRAAQLPFWLLVGSAPSK